jgi:CBS domain-containing protein
LQEGVYLPTGESRDELTGIRVGKVMHTDAESLAADSDIETAKARFDQEKVNSWPVGDGNHVQAVISRHQIESAQPAPATVRDLLKANGNYPFVYSDHPLSHALERMGSNGVDVVPVVSRANIHQMYGIVTLSDILATYGVSGKRASDISR